MRILLMIFKVTITTAAVMTVTIATEVILTIIILKW
jgi:hypothetical protein